MERDDVQEPDAGAPGEEASLEGESPVDAPSERTESTTWFSARVVRSARHKSVGLNFDCRGEVSSSRGNATLSGLKGEWELKQAVADDACFRESSQRSLEEM